jgi:hypothetical protein
MIINVFINHYWDKHLYKVNLEAYKKTFPHFVLLSFDFNTAPTIINTHLIIGFGNQHNVEWT